MTLSVAPITGILAKIYIQSAQGTAITVSTGTVSGGTLIGECKRITPPKPKWGTYDKTVLGTPNTGRLKDRTLLEYSDVKIEGLYSFADAGQALLQTASGSVPNSTNGSAWGFLIVQPTNLAGGQTTIGDQIAFNAMAEFEIGDLEIDKDVPFSANLVVTGPVTVTEGS